MMGKNKVSKSPMPSTEISELWMATDNELLTLIGANALPLVVQPQTLLLLGRKGEYNYKRPDALGDEFNLDGYKKTARLFFKEWQSQLVAAVCEDSKLAADIREATLAKRDVAIALVIGALTYHIPQIASMGGLLTALAVFLVRSGTEAFCKTITQTGGSV
jgi:hypothetical protein